jgi:hypothetical protein
MKHPPEQPTVVMVKLFVVVFVKLSDYKIVKP